MNHDKQINPVIPNPSETSQSGGKQRLPSGLYSISPWCHEGVQHDQKNNVTKLLKQPRQRYAHQIIRMFLIALDTNSVKPALVMLFACIVLISPANSQVKTKSSNNVFLADKHASARLVARKYTNAYPSRDNQFYNDWQQADVYLAGGKVVKGAMIRYNGYEDAMIWQRQSDRKTGSLIKATIDKVRFYQENGSDTREFRTMKVKLPVYTNTSRIYMEVLTEGTLSLYCYRRVKFVKNTPELFYDDYQYMILYNNEMIPISLRRSSLLSIFDKAQRKKFLALMRENNLRFRREADVVRGIGIFNK